MPPLNDCEWPFVVIRVDLLPVDSPNFLRRLALLRTGQIRLIVSEQLNVGDYALNCGRRAFLVPVAGEIRMLIDLRYSLPQAKMPCGLTVPLSYRILRKGSSTDKIGEALRCLARTSRKAWLDIILLSRIERERAAAETWRKRYIQAHHEFLQEKR
jgi:hypothetical protein